MHIQPEGIDPVAIALDRIELRGDLRFSGLDLDSGQPVIVTVNRNTEPAPPAAESADVSGLVLVLTLGRLAREA